MEPYSYVGNNPIRYTDPTGMSKEDHIFTFFGGKLIGMYDTKKGNALVFNINGRNQSLNPSNSANATYFKQVSQFYAKEQGFAGNVNYQIESTSNTRGGYYSKMSNTITLTEKTFLNSSNVNDIKSIMGHEVDHSINSISSFMGHAETYLRQDLNGTSDEYKINNANQYVNRVLNAYDDSKIDSDEMFGAIDNYNARNNGGVEIKGLNYFGTLKGANFKTLINGENKRNSFEFEKLQNVGQ